MDDCTKDSSPRPDPVGEAVEMVRGTRCRAEGLAARIAGANPPSKTPEDAAECSSTLVDRIGRGLDEIKCLAGDTSEFLSHIEEALSTLGL